MYMAGCEHGAFHQFAPWAVRNFSLYFTWIFPWGPLVLDITGQLGIFCILIKLRDPVISLTLVNSPAWERVNKCVGIFPFLLFQWLSCVTVHQGKQQPPQVSLEEQIPYIAAPPWHLPTWSQMCGSLITTLGQMKEWNETKRNYTKQLN